MPKSYYLSVDVETTGLDGVVKSPLTLNAPRYDIGLNVNSLLEVAFKLLDNKLSPIAEYQAFVFNPTHYEAMDESTREFHEKNGFISVYEAAEKKPLSLIELEMIEVISKALQCEESNLVDKDGNLLPYQYGKTDTLMFHGKSVHFDRGFFNKNFPRFSMSMAHQLADISTVRTMLYPIKTAPNKIIAREPKHFAMSDVELAIEETKVFQDYIRLTMPSGEFEDLKSVVTYLKQQ